MPFFPRFQYPTHSTPSSSSYSSFPQDIFRLLDEVSSFSDPATPRRGFSPAFDVHESEHEYVLEGELPGLADKKNVSLEFTDDQTLLVQGKIERFLARRSDGQGSVQTIEGSEEQKKLAEGGENKGKQKEGAKETSKPASKTPKYWVSERSIGEFSRSFSFPSNVDVEKVKASLDHGILKIVVPKMEKPQGRRVEIS